jgi:hypothetical protein
MGLGAFRAFAKEDIESTKTNARFDWPYHTMNGSHILNCGTRYRRDVIDTVSIAIAALRHVGTR